MFIVVEQSRCHLFIDGSCVLIMADLHQAIFFSKLLHLRETGEVASRYAFIKTVLAGAACLRRTEPRLHCMCRAPAASRRR